MNEFVTWAALLAFGSLSTIVYTLTEFTKELPFVNRIKTKYYSYLIALVLILISTAVTGLFQTVDLTLYAISAVFVSLSANGLSDFNWKEEKEK